jgi:hypothetical protein
MMDIVLESEVSRNVFIEWVSDFDPMVTTPPPTGRGVLNHFGIQVSDGFFFF